MMSSPAVNLPPVEQRVIASPGETGRHGHRYYTINRSFHQGINTSTSLLSEPPEGPVEASRPARRLVAVASMIPNLTRERERQLTYLLLLQSNLRFYRLMTNLVDDVLFPSVPSHASVVVVLRSKLKIIIF